MVGATMVVVFDKPVSAVKFNIRVELAIRNAERRGGGFHST